jgi:hypothetical protein
MQTAKPTKRLAADSDLGAVGLVDDAVNLLEIVRVGDDLVTGEDILGAMSALCAPNEGAAASCAEHGEARRGRRGSRAGKSDRGRAGTHLVNDHVGCE